MCITQCLSFLRLLQTYLSIQTSTTSPLCLEVRWVSCTRSCSHSAKLRFLVYSLWATPCFFANLLIKVFTSMSTPLLAPASPPLFAFFGFFFSCAFVGVFVFSSFRRA